MLYFLTSIFFWCIEHFVSMYHIWRLEALTRLKENLRKKWVDDLPNLNLLKELKKETELLIHVILLTIVKAILKNFSYGKLKNKIF